MELILNYQNGDELSVKISNIFGDSYGEYVQSDSVYFETVFVAWFIKDRSGFLFLNIV